MKLGHITEKEILQYAQEQYEQGDTNFTLNPHKSALLVVDMQDEFVKPHWTHFWIPEAIRIVPEINKIIYACRKHSIPISFTVYSKTHQYGSIWHELSQENEDIIIHKSSYGAFYDTPLDTIIKNLEKTTVIITGTLTNYCCSMTARQAYERGFKVIFCSDATATHFPEMQAYELKILRRGFAKIMSTSDICANILDNK
jgi:nicotinamidase-related amidase